MRALLLAVALSVTANAAAQLRSIPADAKRAELRPVRDRVVELDGRRATLAPGAQIRDTANRIVLPGSLPESSLVKYDVDDDGNVKRVWILTPQEAAARD